MKTFFLVLQITTSALLIALIATQGKGSGLGGLFGGASEVYHSRKGAEKLLFRATLAAGAIFLLASIASLVV